MSNTSNNLNFADDTNSVSNSSINHSNDKPPRWVLASNNTGKLAEFKHLFKQATMAVNIVPQGELGIADAVEDGKSFVENAIIKARHASTISGLPAIADDSGLCVPILDGAPGIYSARYAGEHGNDQRNNAKLVADLHPWRRAQPQTPIHAYFVCVLAMVRHQGDPLPIIAQGLWHGEILDAPVGDNGFGYDPLFWLPEQQKTAAQLDANNKNTLSHRAQALAQFKQQLTNI